jgi:hypothetical protein
VEATVTDARTAVLAGVLGKDTKIIWRLVGVGDLTLSAVAPDGARVAPNWVEAHEAASNWTRPGDEWGAGFTFSRPGCWQIHAERTGNAGDLWLLVRS